MQRDPERRKYRILGLIGRGGFGRVYRARLEGPEGFTKQVAIKIVRQDEVSADEIARFRDEARILGLVRDRAVVAVDPPIRLGGQWAMVMEYVDGASAHRLIHRGPMPPRVALEVVAEIARALHKVYSMAGEDGPLHLLHRDLKPANIQITPDGDVKVLDFGVARARFDAREAQTSSSIGGTLGYIAPERLTGREGPEGDVYSLGVLLHVLVTTERAAQLSAGGPVEARFQVERTPPVEAALALAAKMRSPDPAARPTAAEVEQEAAELVRRLDGPSLRQWAAEAVPQHSEQRPDDVVGSVLSETLELTGGLMPRSAPKASTAGAPRWPLLVALVGIGSAGLVLGATGLVFALWLARFGPTFEPAVAPTGSPEAASASAELPPPPVTPQPEPVALAPAVAPSEPAPVAPAPVRAGRPVAPRPAPAEVVPAPEPPPAAPASPSPVEIVAVTFDSEPSGASVYIDGVQVGKTPLRDHPMSAGGHELRLELGGRAVTRTVRVGGRLGATRFSWRDDQLVVR
ncbi:MAG: serine/threonine-protein kinase [Myxococcota bacterium]